MQKNTYFDMRLIITNKSVDLTEQID